MRRIFVTYIKSVLIIVFPLMMMILYFSTKLPFSAVYVNYHGKTQLNKMAEYLNAKRLGRALKYFKTLDRHKMIMPQLRGGNHSLVVCIVTMDRSRGLVEGSKHRYLVQTAAAVDQILRKDTGFNHKLLFICNVDDRPLYHKDAVWLQNFIPYVQHHGNSSFKMKFSSVTRSPLSNIDDQNNRRQKEANDYVFCLNASNVFNYSYILMLEDDVVPTKDVLGVVDYVLRQRLHVHHDDVSTYQPRDFSFLKLYYPEKWQGYAWESDRILELICFGFAGAGIIQALCAIVSICFGKKYLSLSYLNFLLGFLIFTFSASLMGRQAVMELRRYSAQLYKFGPSPRCCTPGMLYNSKIVPKMMDYIIQHTEVNKDLALYDFTLENESPGFLIEPNLLRHIGMFSSLAEAYKPAEEFTFSDV